MLLFRNPYRLQKKTPQPFRHEVSYQEKEAVGICVSCGKKGEGTLYYCPICEEYYCLDCVISSIGGNTCPKCSELTFLQKVKVTS
ncbi:MAG: hypothetical protein KAQ69_11090 [Spirochaetales bacterium]|nr:hypothetical protein [Spirochaetales bacterium]